MQDGLINLDGMLRLSLMEGQARAFLCRSTRLVQQAREIHHLSNVSTAALGRLLTGASMMGAMLKDERDSLTVYLKGGGPMGTILAVARPDGVVKGYAERGDIEPPLRADGKLDVGGAVGRQGQLTVVKDLGLKEPYVGCVNLVSGEIGEDLAMYFTASEQTPSLVSLGVLVARDVIAAGGLIVQVMPGCSDVALRSIEMSAPMFMNISHVFAEYDLMGAMTQLLGHLQPEVTGRLMPAYQCDCTRQRFERGLISLGKQELEDMINEDHGAEVNCQFCNRTYRFTEAQLRDLLARASQRD